MLIRVRASAGAPRSRSAHSPPTQASAPDWISADGTRLTVRVAPLATTGTVTVSTGIASSTSSDTVFVDSYRNTNGFSFHNYTPHITFDQMTQAFGHDQTYDCLGIDACFRDPWAMVVNAIANAFMADRRRRRLLRLLARQPADLLRKPRVHAGQARRSVPARGRCKRIRDRSGDSRRRRRDGPITDYLNAMQVSQLSDEFLGHYVSDCRLADRQGRRRLGTGRVRRDQRLTALRQRRLPGRNLPADRPARRRQRTRGRRL